MGTMREKIELSFKCVVPRPISFTASFNGLTGAAETKAIAHYHLMHRQALLEIFKPVEDDVDLGRSGNSSLNLVRVDNADESTVWQDVCLSRKLRRSSYCPVRSSPAMER